MTIELGTIKFDIIASDGCPTGTAWLFSFNGRRPECAKHDSLKGRPHAPCWSVVRVDTGVK